MPLKVSDGMGAWISDFKKSDAPQFKGKDEKERRDMAIAAFMAAKKESKLEEATYGTQAQRLMSPLQKARQDKEKRDRDRDGKLKSTALPMRKKAEDVEENVGAPQTAAHRRAQSGSRYSDLQKKVKLKGFGPDHAKGNMGNPSARAALKPKTEQYMHEGIDTDKFQAAERDLAQYAQKHGGIDKRQFMDIAKMLGQIGRINILQAGQILAQLNRKLQSMDTDPRDKVYEILKQNKLMEGANPPFDPPYRKVKPGEVRKDRFGNTIKPSNVAKHLAKKAAQSLADKQKKKPLHAQKSCNEETLDENEGNAGGMFFKVSISNLPDLIMVGRSVGHIKSAVRKIVKQPSMITDVERMTRAEVKKRYRDLALGDFGDDDLQTSESTAAYGKSIQAIADKKKKDAISSSDKDKLGKLAAMLSKEKRK